MISYAVTCYRICYIRELGYYCYLLCCYFGFLLEELQLWITCRIAGLRKIIVSCRKIFYIIIYYTMNLLIWAIVFALPIVIGIFIWTDAIDSKVVKWVLTIMCLMLLVALYQLWTYISSMPVGAWMYTENCLSSDTMEYLTNKIDADTSFTQCLIDWGSMDLCGTLHINFLVDQDIPDAD